MAVNPLTELMRTGAAPVLLENGFAKDKRNYFRLTEAGDLQVVSFDPGATAPSGAAAEIGAGYVPRHHLEWLKGLMGRSALVPHYTMALFSWRVAAPAAVSFDAGGGQPYDEWWALGDRTAQSAAALSAVLAQEVVPELMALERFEEQCAVLADTSPARKISVAADEWAPVFIRLGRVPRAEAEAAVDRVPLDGMLAEPAKAFCTWARSRMDTVYSA